MKTMLSIALASAAASFAAMPLSAQEQAAAQEASPEAEQTSAVEIVKRGEDGRAEIVRIDGFEVAVCKDGRTDSCINPRDAGLDWGGKEIDYWPGKPASEIEEPLPESKPEGAEKAE